MGIDSGYGIGSLKTGVCTTATRPASPYTGQTIYDTTLSQVLVYNGTAFAPVSRVLQVVSTTKTDTFSSATTGAWTDITGMTVSVTPSAATNKVFITAAVMASGVQAGTASRYIRLVRDSTAIGIGDTAGSRISATISSLTSADTPNSMVINFLDSPATTSATAYKLQFYADASTFYLNRSPTDPNGTNGGRFASSITVMEISA